jgi:hypothetical protein
MGINILGENQPLNASKLNYDILKEGIIYTCEVSGEINIYNGGLLRKELQKERIIPQDPHKDELFHQLYYYSIGKIFAKPEKPDYEKVLIDFRNSFFTDGFAVYLSVEILKHTKKHKFDLNLVVNKDQKRKFNLVRLENIFTFV